MEAVLHKRRRRTVRKQRFERNGQGRLQYPLPHGGRRPGSGRKPKGVRAGVAHRKRPEPPPPDRGALHVTLRVVDGLPSLRKPRCIRALWYAFAACNDRFGMRLIHFSVQRNHVHLIVEAESRTAVLRGMRGLSIRLARRLNQALDRNGRVIADRYHLRILKNFAQLRRCLAYVLNNERRHCYQHGGWLKIKSYIDPCSSGRYFDGWRNMRVAPPSGAPPPVCLARGYALRTGWRRYGLLATDEIPARR